MYSFEWLYLSHIRFFFLTFMWTHLQMCTHAIKISTIWFLWEQVKISVCLHSPSLNEPLIFADNHEQRVLFSHVFYSDSTYFFSDSTLSPRTSICHRYRPEKTKKKKKKSKRKLSWKGRTIFLSTTRKRR